MLAHDFGIMQETPEKGSYISYEPEKYGCISVHDDYILPIFPKLGELKCGTALTVPDTDRLITALP